MSGSCHGFHPSSLSVSDSGDRLWPKDKPRFTCNGARMTDHIADATSQAFLRRIDSYITAQETEDDRKAEMPEPPWPDEQNVMLKYLVARADEIMMDRFTSIATAGDAFNEAVMYLSVHAWFEGGLAERARSRGVSER